MHHELISEKEFQRIEKSNNPKVEIHKAVHSSYKRIGYDGTQKLIIEILENENLSGYVESIFYLKERIHISGLFDTYKMELLKHLLKCEERFLVTWVRSMDSKSYSQDYIYSILLELFVYIQYDPKISENEQVYELLQNFLDLIYVKETYELMVKR